MTLDKSTKTNMLIVSDSVLMPRINHINLVGIVSDSNHDSSHDKIVIGCAEFTT